MRINGIKTQPNVETIVIPRGNGEDIVIRAAAVLSFDDFLKMCPEPVAPRVLSRNGERQDLDDPGYLEAKNVFAMKRFEYILLTSLAATEGLEWDKVNLNNPDTWPFYRDELKEAGFSEVEVMRIVNTVVAANGLDNARLEEARERFLEKQRKAQES